MYVKQEFTEMEVHIQQYKLWNKDYTICLGAILKV